MKKTSFFWIVIITVFNLVISSPARGLQIYSNSNKPIEVKFGEEFAIALDSKPVGGYRWQLAKPLNQNMLNIVSSGYQPNKVNNIDLKGKEVLFFKAVGIGETMISLKYARIGERDMYPLESKVFIVVIRECNRVKY